VIGVAAVHRDCAIVKTVRTLGRYELLRPLARGGMAEVYLARRRVAGVEKRLVIKRLRRERISDPRFLDLFVKEAQLSMTLVQQNIVPVFDFGRIGDDVFLAMEHIDGKDLGSSLSRVRGVGMPPLIAAFVASECCHALHHAHCGAGTGGLSVVHRDVTPRNVLLSWAGEVKLADFGIASAMGAGDTTLVGTPGYMAPEQARGEALDARTDVYALGLVLWEMLSGTHVRPAADAAALIDAAKRNVLPAMPSEAPAALVEVLRRATDSDRTRRFESAREMSDHLDSFMVGERARSGGIAPAQQLAVWLRERWVNAPDDTLDFPTVEGGRMVTFLDDGTAGVLGTGTMRSMAATAGPGAELGARLPSESEDLSADPSAEGPIVVEHAARPRESGLAPGAATAPGRTSAVQAAADTALVTASMSGVRSAALAAASAPRRAWVLVGVAVAASIGTLVLYRAVAGDRAGTSARARGELVLDAQASSAAPAAAAAADATPQAPEASPAAVVDARGAQAPVDGPVAAKNRGERPNGTRPPHGNTAPVLDAADHGAGEPARRAFTIGAKPWANVTVDDDPQVYETPFTAQLTIGRHRVRFLNPTLQLQKEVTITVLADGPSSYLEILQ
jgi:eukaryotic-like serine/threonine-protein kinase